MTILANHDEMANLAHRVQGAAAEAEDRVESTRSQLQNLEASFQGSTAVAFQDRHAEWEAAAGNLTTALRDLGRWLQSASDTLREHDEAGASSLRA